ncbi:MAG: aminoacyl-tRNA deacylase [Geminicoccaceae bacterium]|nr:MAG: aminoacyl-tRNA deacylase [Geminicoccaceae bacterium]
MNTAAAKGGTPATTALAKAGIAFQRHEYAFAPTADGIGRQAAAALSIAPERLLKTLIVERDDGTLAMALLAVDRQLDLKAAARALATKRLAMAAIPKAERATGYVKGGISPFGQKRRLDAVVDAHATHFAQVLVNGGRRGLQLELAPENLVQALAATIAPIGLPG